MAVIRMEIANAKMDTISVAKDAKVCQMIHFESLKTFFCRKSIFFGCMLF